MKRWRKNKEKKSDSVIVDCSEKDIDDVNLEDKKEADMKYVYEELIPMLERVEKKEKPPVIIVRDIKSYLNKGCEFLKKKRYRRGGLED
jgi:hypothetical protein